MMYLLELLIVVVKIALLATIYTALLLLVVYVLSKTNLAWPKQFMLRKRRTFLQIHFIIGVLLLILKFTVLNETGMGDHNEIPVGYEQSMQNEDFEMTYFFPNLDNTQLNSGGLYIERYNISGQFLCAQVDHNNSNSPDFDYLVYDLKSESLLTFPHQQEYSSYAQTHTLPATTTFKDFRAHYYAFLDKRPWWRWWLLP